MRILFYTSFNSRSRDTESLMQGFIKEGHTVYILTQKEKGLYHEAAAGIGALVFGLEYKRRPLLLFIFKHLVSLIKFSKEHKIDIIYAHLEEPGLIAVLAQYFIKAKVVTCRHIVDEAYLFNNRNFILLNKIVYSLSRHIVVVSQRAKQFMIEKEGIDPEKIYFIPLGYNFNLYDKPSPSQVQKIRDQYKSPLLVLTACRLVPAKRPLVSIKIIEALLNQGMDFKLLLLGEGPQKAELISYISAKNLSGNIFILGQKNNIMDYLQAADVLLHPSLLDSSSVIIKEAGLLKKPIITCRNVGDVDEYLIDNNNSFLMNKNQPEEDAIRILKSIYNNQAEAVSAGELLHKDIFRLFNIENAIEKYSELQKQIG